MEGSPESVKVGLILALAVLNIALGLGMCIASRSPERASLPRKDRWLFPGLVLLIGLLLLLMAVLRSSIG